MAPHYKETDEAELGKCCICFSLRRGVLYFVFLDLIFSFIAFLSFITDDMRPVAGGYSVYGRIAAASLGLLGLMIGFSHGKMGVFDANAERLSVWLTFVYFKVIALLCIYGSDLGALLKCPEGGEGDSEASPTIRTLALNNACPKALIGSSIVFGLKLVFLLCTVYVTRRLIEKWSVGIRYKINFNRDPWFINDKSFEDTTSYMTLDRRGGAVDV
ncbi:unnamed protein product [Amoebophrya sp. A120]|nr:unnamed protein product [Amoebophrya sp. A120]|eukprot:GSA120T00003133001.1